MLKQRTFSSTLTGPSIVGGELLSVTDLIDFLLLKTHLLSRSVNIHTFHLVSGKLRNDLQDGPVCRRMRTNELYVISCAGPDDMIYSDSFSDDTSRAYPYLPSVEQSRGK